MFAIVGIYIAILFYFCFDERISFSKIMGLVLIIACIAFLAFDPKEASMEDGEMLTARQKTIFGLFAVVCALIAPLFWTYKGYYLRKAIDAGSFTSTLDLAVDS